MNQKTIMSGKKQVLSAVILFLFLLIQCQL